MRATIVVIILVFWVGSLGLAYPTITASVTILPDSVTYTYAVLNNTGWDFEDFELYMPASAAGTITSFDWSPDGWWGGITRVDQRMGYATACWQPISGEFVIPSGGSAEFSLTTRAGVPTTYNFTKPGYANTNWAWCSLQFGGVYGNTILPVPAPEPSSLLALFSGLAGVGFVRLRRRK